MSQSEQEMSKVNARTSMSKLKTAFGPRRPLGMAARLSVLMATTYVLVATSQPYERPVACLHLREQVSFDVVGTCGPPGVITVITEEDECGIAVVGAGAVGLPAGGSFDVTRGENDTGLLRFPWTLSGYLTPARADGGADGGVDAVSDGASDVNSEVGPVADASGDAGDAGSSSAGSSGDGGSDAAPAVTVVPVPGTRAAGLGETRECKVAVVASGIAQLVCGRWGRTRPRCPTAWRRSAKGRDY